MKIKTVYFKNNSKSFYINGGTLHISDSAVTLKYFWKTVFEFQRDSMRYEIYEKELYKSVKISSGDICYILLFKKKDFRLFLNAMQDRMC